MAAAPPAALRTLRVDQIGSLIRPPALLAVYARRPEGQATDDELGAAQDQAVRDVIAHQDAGQYPVLSDGEFRRINFQDNFTASVSGFERYFNLMDPPPGQRPGAIGKLTERPRVVHNQPLAEWRFAQSLTATPVKVTVTAPGQLGFRLDYAPETGYRDADELVADVVAIQRQMLGELAAAGCPYVQIDAPAYSEYLDQARMEQARAQGVDPAARLDRDLRSDAAVVAGIHGPTLGIHLCRGNFRDPRFLRTGGYDAIAERLFTALPYDRFLLEYDTERAGGFEPLRFVPAGKVVVLGLVSTKTEALESADEILRRIDEAAKYLPLEQLALSPQCGFSTAIRLGAAARRDDWQWRKLELVQQVAARVWG